MSAEIVEELKPCDVCGADCVDEDIRSQFHVCGGCKEETAEVNGKLVFEESYV